MSKKPVNSKKEITIHLDQNGINGIPTNALLSISVAQFDDVFELFFKVRVLILVCKLPHLKVVPWTLIAG